MRLRDAAVAMGRLLGCLIALPSCAPGRRELPLRPTFSISGQIQLSPQVGADGPSTGPSFFWIDKEGVRRKIEQPNFEVQTGKFNFEFKRENLIRRLGVSKPELFALMGSAFPIERISAAGYEKNEMGYIRFEYLANAPDGTNQEAFSYSQNVVGFPLSASFGNKTILNVATSALVPIRVAAVKVKVKDATGTPLSDAQISIIPLSVLGTAESDLRTFNFKQAENYTPAATLSDAKGEGFAWPVPLGETRENKFQIVASRSGYCPKTSNPLFFSKDLGQIEITLDACSDEKINNPEINFSASFTGQTFVLDKPIGNLEAGTGCTNKETVELSLKNQGSLIRSLLVEIHEGSDKEAPVVLTQVFPTFNESISVNIPPSFANGTKASGSFFISLTGQLSEKDKAAGIKEFNFGLKGDKRISRLSANATDFEIKGLSDTPNVISGLPDAVIKLGYQKCGPGEKIAATLSDNENGFLPNKFHRCSENGITLSRDDVRWRDIASPRSSGERNIRYFYSDRYGNESEDDTGINKLNMSVVKVYVDSDAPDIGDIDLLFKTAIVPKETPVPIVSSGIVEVTPANYKDMIFGFRTNSGTIQCFASSLTNNAEPDAGSALSRFYLGTQTTKIEMFNAGALCASQGLPLSENSFRFPDEDTADATLEITVFDLAGNSSSGQLSIAPCTNTTRKDNEKVCWKN